eukprot:CAMPEP_0169457324 /NCGR_PEP_ID=MMETSP1042-20121227/16819_1 /TAXON_ID=464988 /ORGANISM="Hemiselmis andersenii, Strain CCMP1180" /LENGTH=89 /DNA_ID=CAMNT_0009569593 /DNA_START=887 /DNA_END=1157 /DNA_ORIENTATION=+
MTPVMVLRAMPGGRDPATTAKRDCVAPQFVIAGSREQAAPTEAPSSLLGTPARVARAPHRRTPPSAPSSPPGMSEVVRGGFLAGESGAR